MTRSTIAALIFTLTTAPLGFAAAIGSGVTAAALVQEMNSARQNPAAYAAHLEDMRANYKGREGLHAIDEAIHFLHSARPLQPLTLSPGMCRGAADHCAEQSGGDMGHGNPAARMSRYGAWTSAWGENLSYGRRSAREIIVALIIDDSQPARKHRKNIFNPKFNFAGAAYGPHARLGSVCSMDFAGGYVEKGQQPSEPLFARNF